MPNTTPPPISRKSLEDFEFLLAQHDSQIVSFKGEMTEMKSKLDQIVQAINTLTIASNRSPFDIAAMVSTARDCILIFSSVVAGIIYVTTSQFSADWARQAEYNKQMLRDTAVLESRITQNTRNAVREIPSQ